MLSTGGNTTYVILIGEIQVPDVNFGRPHNYLVGQVGNDTIIGSGNRAGATARILGDFATHGTQDYLQGNAPAAPPVGGDDTIIYFSRGLVSVGAGPGNDRVTVVTRLEGVALIAGDQGDDVLRVIGPGSSLIRGGDGNDSLYAGSGDSDLFGDDGNDYLQGGNGDDKLQGGSGNDVVIGGGGVDEMYGGAGDDTILARDGNWFEIVDGGSGTDSARVDRDFFGSIRDSLTSIETIL